MLTLLPLWLTAVGVQAQLSDTTLVHELEEVSFSGKRLKARWCLTSEWTRRCFRTSAG